MEKQENKKVVFNLNKVQIEDLNGTMCRVEDFCKQIGNQVFIAAPSIELHDAARLIHSGNDVELTQIELSTIMQIVDAEPYYRPFAHIPLMTYLNTLLQQFKTTKEETNNEN
ncbi:hypothetical protein H7F33_05475 [Pedobacter sp. PAMC26386]|nr:hypothetical protein H7F33_05475 [Pedobacter sp. PAMC26386]